MDGSTIDSPPGGDDKRKPPSPPREEEDSDDDEEDRARFELELEFVQCLASPAYLHFLATYRDDDDDDDDDDEDEDEGEMDGEPPRKKRGGGGGSGSVVLQDPRFRAYLVYLRDTWSRPEYAIYLSYPHCLYFLDLLIDRPDTVPKEWALPAYRNFCHQQQFLAWQHRHSTLYGTGTASAPGSGGGSSGA